MKPQDRIILALDIDSAEKALELASELRDHVGVFKIGKELFTSQGPQIVTSVLNEGGKIFLDLKYHDIPNTVKGACRAAARLGVFMVNIHASGGSSMIRAACEGVEEGAQDASVDKPILLAVTVLTSIDESALNRELRIPHSPLDQVVFWAELARDSGADGVVCSPREIEAVRKACGRDFCIVTPGVRPAWSGTGDQKRVLTPSEAVAAGADYIVVGRPIRDAVDRKEAATKIAAEIQQESE